MKKLLIALCLASLLLSGCGMFQSHDAWKKARQENPLQVPPDMDRPATANALNIPPASTPKPAPAAQGASADGQH